jgi:hypothetical protein
VLGNKDAMDAALAWYRARAVRTPPARSRCPPSTSGAMPTTPPTDGRRGHG